MATDHRQRGLSLRGATLLDSQGGTTRMGAQ
jgi:hypothetical protein